MTGSKLRSKVAIPFIKLFIYVVFPINEAMVRPRNFFSALNPPPRLELVTPSTPPPRVPFADPDALVSMIARCVNEGAAREQSTTKSPAPAGTAKTGAGWRREATSGEWLRLLQKIKQ